jgi:predicted DNA-binding ribbon-helix-helix protein
VTSDRERRAPIDHAIEESLDPGPPKKRSITIAGHKTSISLEAAFWSVLRGLAAEEGSSLAALVAKVDAGRGKTNLSSALRVYALERAARR